MNEVSIAMAKLAGVQKAVKATLDGAKGRVRGNMSPHFKPEDVYQYFHQAAHYLNVLRREMPPLYGDFHQWSVEPETLGVDAEAFQHYSQGQMERLVRDIDHLFEIRANSELGATNAAMATASRRVFITHGRSKDWFEVQAHIEKDLGLRTMELSQEASGGKTVIEKLETGSDLCDSAVIVMTGDDTDSAGVPRARENVMHEIGYFHGKYGRSHVVLLHEEGVNAPANLAGIVYVPYPKGLVSAAFAVMSRELRAIYGR